MTSQEHRLMHTCIHEHQIFTLEIILRSLLLELWRFWGGKKSSNLLPLPMLSDAEFESGSVCGHPVDELWKLAEPEFLSVRA